jgi:hypothetical protein
MRSDTKHLTFRDRIRIERSLFRLASMASFRLGVRLTGLDVARNRVAFRPTRRHSLALLTMKASRLRARLAAVSTVDSYVQSEFSDPTILAERQRVLRRLAQKLDEFALQAEALLRLTRRR